MIGTDGTGEDWEYTDGYAYRIDIVTDPSSVFMPDEWVIGGVNSLETGDDVTELALVLSSTTPGAHDLAAVPVPAAVWLMGSGLLGLAARARRRVA